MQQLYLTGPQASEVAQQLFDALNIRPTGFCLTPLMVDGARRGDALHLLLPPGGDTLNNVPCRVSITPTDATVVPRTLDEIAAPALQGALNVHAPMLMDRLHLDMLHCNAFRSAVYQCLMGDQPVVVVAQEDACYLLRALTPAHTQLWLNVPQDPQGRRQLLETLVEEMSMRL